MNEERGWHPGEKLFSRKVSPPNPIFQRLSTGGEAARRDVYKRQETGDDGYASRGDDERVGLEFGKIRHGGRGPEEDLDPGSDQPFAKAVHEHGIQILSLIHI